MAIVAKKKIMSLAKSEGVAADDLVRLLNEKGHQVKSPFSSVDTSVLDEVREGLEKLKSKAISKKSSGKATTVKKGSSSKKEETSNDSNGNKKLMGAKITLRKNGDRKKASDENRSGRASEIFKTKEPKKEVAKPTSEEPIVESKAPVKAPVKKVEEATKNLFKDSSKPSAKKPVSTEKKSSTDNADSKKSNLPDAQERSRAQLKVKVEAPTAEMAARIAKLRGGPGGGRNNGGRNGGRGGAGPRGGAGYTGKFSTSTSGNEKRPGGPKTGGAGAPRGSGGADRNRPKNSSMAAAFNQRSSGGQQQQQQAGGPRGNGGPPMPGANAPFQNGKPGAKPTVGKRNQGGKKGKPKHQRVNKEREINVRANITRVMASLSKNPTKKVYRKDESGKEEIVEKKILKVSDFVTINELAGLMNVMSNQVMAKCMELGMMVTINHRLDFETIQLLADEFEYEAELMEEYEEDTLSEEEEVINEADLVARPPVVTVMGHVDHGKTSLLDWVRKERVATGEAGGITQHVGAYSVSTAKGDITLLDTPGHEAFTAMRARGSQLTDVVVLVVAADDRVMPQTIESIEHAKAAGVPIVVAINKCDRETANPDKIRAQLAEYKVEVEQWGGKVSCIEVSAKTGMGMETLLETLALETEMLQLKANPKMNARAVVVESKLDKGKGAIATILIQQGTLRVGDHFVAGIHLGRVRALLNEKGKRVKEVGPGYPCQIMGLDGAPFSGDKLTSYDDERSAKNIAQKRSIAAKERELRSRRHMTLDQLYDRVKAGNFTDLNVIVKADVDGSAEAISNELEKLSNKEVKVNVIRKAVGNINETDVMLASASDAIIVAFHLLPAAAVRAKAEEEGVDIKQYRIIYEIIDEFRGVVEGLLKPVFKEVVVGEAEIKQLFKITKVGWIAGSVVTTGAVDTSSKMRIYRNGVELGSGSVRSLKRHQDEVTSVKAGFECGIGIDGFEGMKEGDNLAFFNVVEVTRTLKDVESE